MKATTATYVHAHTHTLKEVWHRQDRQAAPHIQATVCAKEAIQPGLQYMTEELFCQELVKGRTTAAVAAETTPTWRPALGRLMAPLQSQERLHRWCIMEQGDQ